MHKKFFLIIYSLFILSGCTQSASKNSPTSSSSPVLMQNITEKNLENKIIKRVSTSEFKNFIENKKPEDIILDIRTLEEFENGHIKGAELLDFYSPNFKDKISQLDKNKTYYLYCHSGNRSSNALDIMENLGFTSIYELEDGIWDWGRNGFEVVR